MIPITIDPHLKALWPDAALGGIQCKVEVHESQETLLEELEQECLRLRSVIEKVPDIPKREKIAATRSAYKAFGKEPSRYRNSAEAMCRRIIQGKELYHINNVVETNNLYSVRSGYSLGAYDVSKIEGPILWQVAPPGSHYQGIGKDQINVEYLPVFSDGKGIFGNPTSDSTRTRVTAETKELLMVIFSFNGSGSLHHDIDELYSLLQTYCHAYDVEIITVQ